MMRARLALYVIAAASCVSAISAIASCSKSDASNANADAGDGGYAVQTPPEWNRAVTRPSSDSATQSRAACTYQRGALAGETLSADVPIETAIPIEHFVIVMQENRSFDHYFGQLNAFANRTDIESPPPDAGNPEMTAAGGAPDGGSPFHALEHAQHLCFLDTNHEWEAAHDQYDNGKMDGFFQTNHDFAGENVPDPAPATRDGIRALYYYDQRDIPFYYALASTFAIGDHYFSSLLGPTWPNRMFLYGATSFGMTYNSFSDIPIESTFPNDDTSIMDELEKRHISWTLYTAGGPPGPTVMYSTGIAERWQRQVTTTIDQFYAAAKAGSLPQVSFVDANYLLTGTSDGNDEHPPADMQIGQSLVYQIVNAVLTSPEWSNSALFFAYDEHGGLYDHLPPPSACAPDSYAPIDEDGGGPAPYAFDRYGVRVPFVVVSPFAKAKYVSHTVFDHTSLTRLLEAKYRVPALTARDANAVIPTDLFDFQNPPFVVAPTFTQPSQNSTELTMCKAIFPTATSGL